MLTIVGMIVVLAAVIGGFLMEKGHLLVLVQPAELLIIGGAALGTLLIANPPRILKQVISGLGGALGKSAFGKANYVLTLKMLYDVLSKARRLGILGIEPDIEKPAESPLFEPYKQVIKNHHYRDFVCDTLRMAVAGGIDPFDMDQMMERDMEVHHHCAMQPIAALTTMADSLPGLGIVAAVLGVVITMGSLDGPPAEIGHKVAAALVGTFLGILLCYGFIGPVGSSMSKAAEEEHAYLGVIRIVLISYLKGQPPVLAVEAGRRAIPGHVRPGFAEVEAACRGGQPGAAGAGAVGEEAMAQA